MYYVHTWSVFERVIMVGPSSWTLCFSTDSLPVELIGFHLRPLAEIFFKIAIQWIYCTKKNNYQIFSGAIVVEILFMSTKLPLYEWRRKKESNIAAINPTWRRACTSRFATISPRFWLPIFIASAGTLSLLVQTEHITGLAAKATLCRTLNGKWNSCHLQLVCRILI